MGINKVFHIMATGKENVSDLESLIYSIGGVLAHTHSGGDPTYRIANELNTNRPYPQTIIIHNRKASNGNYYIHYFIGEWRDDTTLEVIRNLKKGNYNGVFVYPEDIKDFKNFLGLFPSYEPRKLIRE